MYTAIAINCNNNNYSSLGSLYASFTSTLSKKIHWNIIPKKKIAGRFHLLIGDAQALNIPYKLLSGYDSLYPGITPLINFYRGFNVLCRKTMMTKTLRAYLNTSTCPYVATHTYESICPETFLFYPSKPEESEREAFIKSHSERPGVWIMKPSDGCKGHSISITDSADDVLASMDSQRDGSIAWVVQRYLDRPLLIPRGKRKFDIRVWVLLDENYDIHVYGQGALRVSAETYVPGSWQNIHAHLSNHCIAETHDNYGMYEPTNEIWYDEFEDILSSITDGRVSFHDHIIPRIHEIIKLTLLAVREQLKGGTSSAYRAFNVFGYDFMLTEAREDAGDSPGSEVGVYLLEINSSPAVADKLLPRFVDNLIALVVDRNFPPDQSDDGNVCGESVVAPLDEDVSLSNGKFPEAFITIYSDSTNNGNNNDV